MKGIKFPIIFSYLMVLLLIIAGCGSNTEKTGSQPKDDGKKKYTFKVATASAEPDQDSQLIYKGFMDKVTELTDGKVQFDWYPAQQLGSIVDYIDMTADGAVDIAMFAVSVFPNEMPLGNTVTGIPGIYKNAREGSIAYNNLTRQSPMLDTDFLSHGVRPLVAITTAPYNVYTKNIKIKTPKDLKGVKLRTSGGLHAEMVEFAGGIPVAIPSADMYEAYEKGAVDGLHGFASSDTSGGYREVSNYGTRNLNFSGGTTGLMMNAKLFDGLPEDIQKAFMEAGDYIAANGSKAYEDDVKAREDRWVKNGDVDLYEPTESEKEQWQKYYDDFTEYYLKKKNSEDVNKVIKMFREEVEKVRKQ
ncbi:TRAP transporter substrate-binding protein DctP [Neobacillus mesonae]|uniref:TRAP transporter substrate-binding protein DctP n=1 Tax=Neobacillus mesonae TaxID=1193713 RepID=UPI00203D05EA|nr:TRAP transporter substrate-binding protein DctP [Neobacillus mesonae]MCM3567501.1 TRAP transporter substrate-binding protein DctP [Neobacillus mesonae]